MAFVTTLLLAMAVFRLQLESWEAFPLRYHNNFKFKLKDHSVRAFLARVHNKKQDVLELQFHSSICFFCNLIQF